MTAPARIRLSRAADWRQPPGAVVVLRPTMWGNPWRPGRPSSFDTPGCCPVGGSIFVVLDAADAVDLYRRLLVGGPDPVATVLPTCLSAEDLRRTRDDLRRRAARVIAALPTLRGRDLCCWCPLDAPCHADVLLDLANR